MKTIIEPFRIKAVEPLKFTTPDERRIALDRAANKDALRGYRITSSAKRLRHFTAEFAVMENAAAAQPDEALAFAG